jgi:nitrogen-specific signal transduction histidine kinase
VLLKVQDKFQNKVSLVLDRFKDDGSVFRFSTKRSEDLAVLVGEIDFLETESAFQQPSHQVVLFNGNQLPVEQVYKIGQRSKLHFVNSESDQEIEQALLSIKSELNKQLQVLQIKNEIQKKRKELEQLNNQLISESEKKIQFLEISHIEETEKNQNEKSLLHFLDFIQSESVSDDFPEKLFRFIWKDLKKFGRVYTLGISHYSYSGKAKISFFDGLGESTSVAQLDFAAGGLSNQLAAVWGRPVGKILYWALPKNSQPSHLFLEVVDQQMDMTKTNAYISERIAIISMYLDRWMIEKEIELVVARWKNTFKSFSGYTHVIDENFKIYHANYASGKSTGEHCYKVLAGRDAPCESCPILKNKNSSFFLKKDQFVKTYFSQFKFQEQKYYFVIYEDITKINQLHSQIIQTEKMSTLGRLGNHLAHELNNPLTGMKSYVQTVLQDQEVLGSLPSTATSDLSEILKAAVRCQKIIKNFIEFSQKKEPVLEEVSFNEVLQNTLVLLKTALRNHRLFIDLKDDKIKANAHDLQQVLFNLIKNSCQAMKTPGSIKIYLERRDKKLFFNVEDSGPGFDSSVLENIFQPFMTTKAQGEGTGLGLYLSKKLINNMHADMQVSSSAKGAKISLIFDEL